MTGDDPEVSSGTLYLSKGKLSLEIKKPKKSRIVYNEDAMWIESRSKVNKKEVIQVIKIESKEILKKSSSMMALMFGDQGKLWNAFTLLSNDEYEKKRSKVKMQKIVLQPIKGVAPEEVVEVVLVFNRDKMLLDSISYKDELENNIKYIFKTSSFKDRGIKESRFQYKIPKGATVSRH